MTSLPILIEQNLLALAITVSAFRSVSTTDGGSLPAKNASSFGISRTLASELPPLSSQYLID